MGCQCHTVPDPIVDSHGDRYLGMTATMTQAPVPTATKTTLTLLSKRDANVSATIYTRQLSQQQQLDLQRHNQQYPSIAVNYCQRNHDRFLIIDDMVYLFGASLKDAGKKLFAYIKRQETPASELLNNIR